jgi:hypothetical protein
MPDFDRMSRRLILRDHVGAADIRSFSEAAGWTFLGDIARDPEKKIFCEAQWDIGDGSSAHYVVDEFADVHYMVATDGKTDSLIETGLSVWTVDEMLEDCYVHVYPAGWSKSLLRLGAGAPLEADKPVMDHIIYSVRYADKTVRRAALWAMVYTAWPDFEDTLAELTRDEDPQVANEARLALETFPRLG